MALRYELLGYKPERYLSHAKRQLLLLKRRRIQSQRQFLDKNILVTDNSRIYLRAGPVDLIRIIGAAAPPLPPIIYSEGAPHLFNLRRTPSNGGWEWQTGYVTGVNLSSTGGDPIIPVYETALDAGLIVSSARDLNLTLEDKLAAADAMFDKGLGLTLARFIADQVPEPLLQSVPAGNAVLNEFVQGQPVLLHVFRDAGELYVVYRVDPGEDDNVLPDVDEDGSFEQRPGEDILEHEFPGGLISYRFIESAVSRKSASYGLLWMVSLREYLSAPESDDEGLTVDVATTSDTFDATLTYGAAEITITVTDLAVPTSFGANDKLWVYGGTATRIDPETVRVAVDIALRWLVWNGTIGTEFSSEKTGRLLQSHALHDVRSLWTISALDKVNFGAGTDGGWGQSTQVLFYSDPPGSSPRRWCYNYDAAGENYTFEALDDAGSVLNPLHCERRQSSNGNGYNYIYQRYQLVERFALTFDINGPIKTLEPGYSGDGYSYTGWSNIADYEYTYVPLGEINYALFAWEHGAKVSGVWDATLTAGDSSRPVGEISRAFDNGHVATTQIGGQDAVGVKAIVYHDRTKTTAVFDYAADQWVFRYQDHEILRFDGSYDVSNRLRWWDGGISFPTWANEWNNVVILGESVLHPGSGRNPPLISNVPGYSGLDDVNQYCRWWAGCPPEICPDGGTGSNSHAGTGIVGIGATDAPTAVQLDLPVVALNAQGLCCAYWVNASGSVAGICYALVEGSWFTLRQDYYEQLYRFGDPGDPAYEDQVALDAARAALDAVQTVLVNNFANELLIDNLLPGRVLVVLK